MLDGLHVLVSVYSCMLLQYHRPEMTMPLMLHGATPWQLILGLYSTLICAHYMFIDRGKVIDKCDHTEDIVLVDIGKEYVTITVV